MFIVLTQDLYLLEWAAQAEPPAVGETIVTDHGEKIVLRTMDDYRELGLPSWIEPHRVHLAERKEGRLASPKNSPTA